MSLLDRLNDDLKTAMKEKTEPNRTVLRSLVSAIKNEQIAQKGDLDEAGETAVIQKQLKQREEAAEAYGSDRPELAEKEKAEAAIIKHYLPEMMSEEDVKKAVTEAISSTGATDASQMGQVMGALKGKLAGKADMGAVSAEVKRQLE